MDSFKLQKNEGVYKFQRVGNLQFALG